MKIGSVNVRDIRKNVPILQVGGSTPGPAPHTPPVIRVVLLHKERFAQSFNSLTVCASAYAVRITSYLIIINFLKWFENSVKDLNLNLELY